MSNLITNGITATSVDTLSNKTFIAPVLGTPLSGTATNVVGLPLSTGVVGTLAPANGGTGQTSLAGLTANLSVFTSGTNGLAPASGGGTTNFLRADGTWAAPAGGGGGGGGTVTSIAISGGTTGLTVLGSPITTSGTITLTGILAVSNGGTGVTTSTGSGNLVLHNSPTFVNPALGTPASGVATNLTGLPLTSGVTGILPIANGGTGVSSLSGLVISAVTASFPNNSGSTIAAMTPVATDSSGNLVPVDVGSESTCDGMIGIVPLDILSSTTGTVHLSGVLQNVTIAGAPVGSIVYVSSSGGLTIIKPSIGINGFVAGNFVIRVGIVTKNQSNPSNKDLVVKIEFRGQL